MHDKRNSAGGIAGTVSGDDERGSVCAGDAGPRGVGAGLGAPTAEGGGYLDICTICGAPFAGDYSAESAHDPRLDELTAARVPAEWVEIAHAIGYDAFMIVWAMLLAASSRGGDECHRVRVPRMTGYVRHQRNMLIARMTQDGRSFGEIREAVHAIADPITDYHLSRLQRQLAG